LVDSVEIMMMHGLANLNLKKKCEKSWGIAQSKQKRVGIAQSKQKPAKNNDRFVNRTL
jgi:hypothetical protein